MVLLKTLFHLQKVHSTMKVPMKVWIKGDSIVSPCHSCRTHITGQLLCLKIYVAFKVLWSGYMRQPLAGGSKSTTMK